jgi:tRNA pseudouridine13 synthase
VAGLKDKRALTRQWFSLPAKFEERLSALGSVENIRVLETSKHSNKLKIGHLRGNQFRILLRGVVKTSDEWRVAAQVLSGEKNQNPDPALSTLHSPPSTLHDSAAQASAILTSLAAQGVPNYFGPQRFGLGGQNAERGYDLVTGKRVHVLPWLKKFLVSSLQSLLFNDWVQVRLEQNTFDQVIEGDVAKKHDSGGEFVVEDAEAENPRALRFEISATGPLYGKKYRESAGAARQIEDEILARYELTREHFDRRFGDRRLIRFPLADWSVEAGPEGLWVSFFLPKGAYATAVLRELMKRNPEEGEVEEAGEQEGGE